MTTAVLRPTSTVNSFGAVITQGTAPGATAHQVTADNSDSSYATLDSKGDTILVEVTNPTVPAGAMPAMVRLRARMGINSYTADLQAALRIDSPSAGQMLFETQMVGSATAEYATSWLPLPSTFTGINDVRAYVARSSSGVSGNLRVFEVYIDYLYVEIPVPALALIPDPYTAGTQIAMSWTNTLDADGGPQTHYRIIVTDDNNSNAVIYDTLGVASSATSAVTAPLLNGGEYTPYVLVAQTVNGVQHWSLSDGQADVDLAVTTVDVSSVTASADNANAKITVTVTRDVADGAWEYVEVERTDDGGTTWVPVRGSTFVVPSGANTHVVEDYEAPNGVAVDYRARATYYVTGQAITSAWTETASTTTWSSSLVWFKVPGSPSLNDTFDFKQLPSSSRPMRYGLHAVLGVNRPVVVTDARSSPDARCVAQTGTEAEADAFLAIMAQPVVLIQTPTSFKRWGSRYCVVRNLDDTPLSGAEQVMTHSGYAVWSFDAIEVDSPGDPDAGAL